MSVLDDWQKITRVIPGKPFGNGADGNYSSASIPAMTARGITGTATSTTLNLSSAGYANGDILFLHKTRGNTSATAGSWEINKVVSGGGTSTLTLDKPLKYTYVDSGSNQSQSIKIPQYDNATALSGTWSIPTWNQSVNGIFIMAVRELCTITGTVLGTNRGFNGGIGQPDGGHSDTLGKGEGADAARGSQTWGAGGFQAGSSGAGGGYGTDGVNGTTNTKRGLAYGSADLSKITFGGGAGAGSSNPTGGAGGKSAVLSIIIAKEIVINGAITQTGDNGTTAPGDTRGGGGGSGGAVLLVCETATIGTNKITALGGSGGGGTVAGGAGGVGRIAIHYSDSVTGTTNPTFNSQLDPSLKEAVAGGAFVFNML